MFLISNCLQAPGLGQLAEVLIQIFALSKSCSKGNSSKKGGWEGAALDHCIGHHSTSGHQATRRLMSCWRITWGMESMHTHKKS